MQRIAQYDRAGLLRDLADETIDEAFLHRHASARGADLSGVEECAAGRRRGRLVDVGIVEHHHRAVTAPFTQHWLAGAALGDAPPGRSAAGEADAVRVRMRHDLVADRGTLADDEVQHARRQPCRLDRLHECDGDGRRGRRGHPNDGVVEEAVRVANDTEYGLSAAVFGRNVTRALAVSRRLETGICHINGPTAADEAQMPFGGVKASGYGRFGDKAVIGEFTNLRWITIERP